MFSEVSNNNNDDMDVILPSNTKNIDTILYCRQSRRVDREGDMSLDSQEFAIKGFMRRNGLRMFKTIKDIGSAFRSSQNELKTVLRSCKNKIIVVYEPSRLSRNTRTFKDIYDICRKNKHNIGIVTMGMIFNHGVSSNYEILYKLIQKAEQESVELGRRISRSIRYKKSRETVWGKKRNEDDLIVDNDRELQITKLIVMLGREGSSTDVITRLINKLKTVETEPFEIVEYDSKPTSDSVDTFGEGKLPYGMSSKNIAETLNLYGIKKRKAKWQVSDIRSIRDNDINNIQRRPIVSSSDINNLVDDFGSVNVNNRSESKEESTWLCVMYSPSLGLPPGVRLPEGMELPSVETLLYIPRI